MDTAISVPSLIDPFGRHVSYLRISVTDRCDFRCVYCMSEHMEFLPKSEVLSFEEIDQIALAFIEPHTSFSRAPSFSNTSCQRSGARAAW